MPYEDWSLSEEFWTEFVNEYWEKKPTVIPKPFGKEIITQAEALAVLSCATSKEAEFYVEGLKYEGVPDEIRPQVGEVSVDEYVDRMHTT